MLDLTHRMPLVASSSTAAFEPGSNAASDRAGNLASNLASNFAGNAATKAALALFHGYWQHAHNLSQDLDTPEGTFIHALVHRQEPDPGNSAYWFRKLGKHPTFPIIHERAELYLTANPVKGWKLSTAWNPLTFLEWVEYAQLHPGSSQEHAAIELQHLEWLTLYEWCCRLT